MCISAEIELLQSSPIRSPNSTGAASLYLLGKGIPERSSSRVLETPWRNFSAGNPAPERNLGLVRTKITQNRLRKNALKVKHTKLLFTSLAMMG
jgi:hypothetical protein